MSIPACEAGLCPEWCLLFGLGHHVEASPELGVDLLVLECHTRCAAQSFLKVFRISKDAIW